MTTKEIFKMTKSEMFKLAHQLTRGLVEHNANSTKINYQSMFAYQLRLVHSIAARKAMFSKQVTKIVECLKKIGFEGDINLYIHEALEGTERECNSTIKYIIGEIDDALAHTTEESRSSLLKYAMLGGEWMRDSIHLAKYYIGYSKEYSDYFDYN